MTTMIAVGIVAGLALLGATVTALVTWKLAHVIVFGLEALAKQQQRDLDAVRAEIAQVYLTADDRKVLGIPVPTVPSPTPPPPGDAGVARPPLYTTTAGKRVYADGKPILIPACDKHAWSASSLEKPRRANNQGAPRTDSDGRAYVRTCINCGARQAFVWVGSTARDMWRND